MAQDLRERLREALTSAMKEQDTVAAAAFRSTLAAIANAEAIEAPAKVAPRIGLGAGESARKELSDNELTGIVRAEMAERMSAAMKYEQLGRHAHARRLRAEAAALEPYL